MAGCKGSAQTLVFHSTTTSTTVVWLQTLKKSASMISYRSGASKVLWCIFLLCCMGCIWQAHEDDCLSTAREERLCQLWLFCCCVYHSSTFMRASPTNRPMSGVTALSTMPPSTSNPKQQEISSLSFLPHPLPSPSWVRVNPLKCDLNPCRYATDMSLWLTVSADPLCKATLGGVQSFEHVKLIEKLQSAEECYTCLP